MTSRGKENADEEMWIPIKTDKGTGQFMTGEMLLILHSIADTSGTPPDVESEISLVSCIT